MGYKRIDNNKVEKTFGQCSILVHRLLHECERQAYDAYIFYIYNKNESHLLTLSANPLLLAEYLACNFEVWVDDRLKHSTDEVLRFGLNFVKIARMYRMFRRSLHAGDFISIEYLWTWFLPIFVLLDKRIYIEIALNQIETIYQKKSYFALSLMRMNRTARLHDGQSANREECAEWSLDAIIENFH